jgi:hypothetical protein
MPRKIRDYKDEYAKYQGKPTQVKNRAKRNKAHRDAGNVPKGYDVDHKVALSKGGSNSKSNTRVVKASTNRSFKRTKTGSMK